MQHVRGGAEASLGELVDRTQGLQPWRRVFHAGVGVGIALALVVLEPSRREAVAALGALAAAQLTFDWLRLRIPWLNHLFFRIVLPLASPREAVGVASSTWYVAGCLLAVALFPPELAVSAILVLALADPAASWIGRVWGRRPFGTGTLEGFAVFALVTFAVLAPRHGPAIAALSAPAAAFLERTPWRLDDNLVTPLGVGVLVWALTWIL